MKAEALLERAVARFWSRVSIGAPDECWPWQHTQRDKFGYGGFWFNGKSELSHRVAWAIAIGPIPPSMCVLHRCDNPKCVNPWHLFIGTKSDNAHDRHSKGRTARGYTIPIENRRFGEKNNNSALTSEDVVWVREAHMEGWYLGVLADMLGVSRSTIGRAVCGATWRHVS